MSKIEELSAAVENGKSKLVPNLVQECLDEGDAPLDVLNHGMIDAMSVVGEKFKKNEIFVPEMLVAARAMKKGVDVLKPHLSGENDGKIGKMVMGTVYGDLHDIGKNLVIMMIESSGYEVVDLGIDVSIEKFVQAAEDPNVTVVGVSALLTTTMPAMKEVVAALNKSPRRKDFKIMVGGAPITQEFCDEIGADVYTPRKSSPWSAAQANSRPLIGKYLLRHGCRSHQWLRRPPFEYSGFFHPFTLCRNIPQIFCRTQLLRPTVQNPQAEELSACGYC